MQANVVINELAKRSHLIPFSHKQLLFAMSSKGEFALRCQPPAPKPTLGWHEKWFKFLGFNKIVLICPD